MATPKIPYPDHGQGIFFFLLPSHPLEPQTSASSSPPGSVLYTPLSTDKTSSAANDRAWALYCGW
jgi:hypothetical protein